MAQTAEADAAKIAEVTDILDKQVLTVGRDAIMWLEKIKRLHQQMINSVVSHVDVKYHAAIALGNNIKKIETETSLLQGEVTTFKEWDIKRKGYPSHELTGGSLNHVEEICSTFIETRNILRALLAALKVMESGIVKELEGDAYVARDLAGFEALLWKIDNELPHHPAHAAVDMLMRKTRGIGRKQISRTRRTERKEHHMQRRLNRVISHIRGIKAKIEGEILPKISGGIFDQLEGGAEDIKRFVQDSTRYGFVKNLDIFRIYLAAGRKITTPSLKAAITAVAKKYQDLITTMDSLGTEISKLEAREGALEQQEETVIVDLKKGIAELEKKGILPKK